MSKQFLWHHARIGTHDSDGDCYMPFPGVRFSIERIDELPKQHVAAWPANAPRHVDAYDALVERVGPCVILCFSQSGNFGWDVARRHPDRVKGLILVQPSGSPDPAVHSAAQVAGIPSVFLWGDNLAAPLWQRVVNKSRTWFAALQTVDAATEWIDLPARGIVGNTHLMMMDTNSDTVAASIQDWCGRHGLWQ